MALNYKGFDNRIEHTTLSEQNGIITLTADDGYMFDEQPNINQFNSGGATYWYADQTKMTVSSDKKTATYDLNTNNRIQPAYPIRIWGTVVADVPQLEQTITNEIPNTTYELTDTEIIVRANTGYKFDEPPTGYNELASLMNRYFDFELSADGKTATHDRTTGSELTDTDEYNLVISGSVVEDVVTPDTYTIVNDIQNTDFEVSGDVLTITAHTGYKFDEPPTAYQTLMQNFECNLSSDGKTAVLDLAENGYSKSDEITLMGDTIPDSVPQPTYDVVNDIAHTTFVLSGTVVTLTADTGYKFENVPQANNFESGAPLDQRSVVDFNLSADGKTATLDLANNDSFSFPTGYEITLEGTVVAETTYNGFYGSINVYEVSNENLKAFAGLRFTDNSGDLGKYVAKLFRLFVPVGETADAVITCGNINTNIQAKTPLNDTVILDFGNVLVPFHNNDITDYNSTIQVFLPFVGFVNIDTKYIGENINLTYEVNLIEGEAVVRLSAKGDVFAVYECKPCSEILYKTSDVNTIGNLNFQSRYMYGLQPYVMVTWKTSKNEYVNNADCKRVVIGSVSGFARYSEVTEIFSPQMSADERQMIINQLNTGVYVERQD